MPLDQAALAHRRVAVTETRDKIRGCILEKLHLTFYVYLTGYARLTGGFLQQTSTLPTEVLLKKNFIALHMRFHIYLLSKLVSAV